MVRLVTGPDQSVDEATFFQLAGQRLALQLDPIKGIGIFGHPLSLQDSYPAVVVF